VLAVVRVCNQAFVEHARFPEMGATVVRYVRDFPEWQWGAFAGDRLRGFILTEPRADNSRASIRLIASDPEARGSGVGGRLVATFEAQARERGVPLLSVGTPFARVFYEKQGFRCVKIDLKVIREILGQRVEPPENLALRPLDRAGAATVVGALESDELRAKFLSAYLESFRRSPGAAGSSPPWPSGGPATSTATSPRRPSCTASARR
jgi:GNAT superfamily N-acetyltransferase